MKILPYAACALIFALLGAAATYLGVSKMDKSYAFRLKEPMLIATSGETPHYLLPANTVLYHQESFSEGHSLFTLEVMFKGKLEADRLAAGDIAEPLWLYSAETEDVGKLLKDYPLSKADLVRILKARQVTREELEQIIVDWPN